MPSKHAEPIPLRDKMALTLREVADLTGYNYFFIRDQVIAGKLPAVAPGGNERSRRIRPADVDAWLQAHPWEPAA